MFVNDFSQTSYLYVTSDQHVRGDKGIDKNVGTAPSVWVYPIVLLLFFFSNDAEYLDSFINMCGGHSKSKVFFKCKRTTFLTPEIE